MKACPGILSSLAFWRGLAALLALSLLLVLLSRGLFRPRPPVAASPAHVSAWLDTLDVRANANGSLSSRVADALCAGFHPRPRVAVCVIGGVRTFLNPVVHLSILEYAVNALGNRRNVDVFFSFRRGDDTEGEHRGTLEEALALFDPSGVEFLDPPSGSYYEAVGNPKCPFHRTSHLFAQTSEPDDASRHIPALNSKPLPRPS